MKTPKKITRVTANALAQQVEDKLSEVQRETQNRLFQECTKTAEYKELKGLSVKIQTLIKQFYAKGKVLAKKHPDIDIDTYSDGEISVRKNCRVRGLDSKRIASVIIAANHVDGVPIDGLVSYAVKQELARKEPKCE